MCEVDDKSNGDIAIEHRLEWMKQLRRGDFDHLSLSDLKKYLCRGIQQMPWTEMSQSDFLIYVVPNELLDNEKLLESSISIMRSVVENPGTTKYSFGLWFPIPVPEVLFVLTSFWVLRAPESWLTA